MPLDVGKLGTAMITEAANVAKGEWAKIREAASIEIRGLAQRIGTITELFLGHKISKKIAQRHLRTARFQVVATIAMLTSMIEAAVEKVINAVLAVVSSTVNSAIGFKLI